MAKQTKRKSVKKRPQPKDHPVFRKGDGPAVTDRTARKPSGNPIKNGEIFGNWMPKRQIGKVRSN